MVYNSPLEQTARPCHAAGRGQRRAKTARSSTLMLGGIDSYRSIEMKLSYFDNQSWSDITREERAFCAELEYHIRMNPDDFVALLKRESGLPDHLAGPWDTAFEACFYRDYLHSFRSAEKRQYSPKRTFDLALFSEKAIIIIEAKAAEPFTADQARVFERDRTDIRSILGPNVEVHLVALASQVYFDNYDAIGRGTALAPFAGCRISWQALARHYGYPPLLRRACEVYERSPLAIVDNDALPYWMHKGDVSSDIERLSAEIELRNRAIEVLKRKRTT